MQPDAGFHVVGREYQKEHESQKKKDKRLKEMPLVSMAILGVILIVCFGCQLFMTHDPTYMDLTHYDQAPGGGFWFGTDTMGRDIFSMILYGGRISLCIGLLATVISTVIAVVYGALSGIAPEWLDECMMRFTEILLSIPSLLIIIFVQAIIGKNNVVVIAIVIGVTSWMSIAKIVRTEVRQIRQSDYLIASKCMGAGFFHILKVHLLPNFVSSIMFMVIMNIRGAIVAESTLSFLGIGLPMEVISWGSMLSLAEKALMTNSWWIILIPGVFLVVTLLCITNVGNYIRKSIHRKQSNML